MFEDRRVIAGDIAVLKSAIDASYDSVLPD